MTTRATRQSSSRSCRKSWTGALPCRRCPVAASRTFLALWLRGGEATSVLCGLTTALEFAHLGLRCPTSDCTRWSGRSQVPAGRDRAAVRRRLALRRPARLFQPLPQGPRWVTPWQRPAVPVGITTAALAVAVPTNPTPAAARHGTQSRCRTARHGNKFRAIDSRVRSGGEGASESERVSHSAITSRKVGASCVRACVRHVRAPSGECVSFLKSFGKPMLVLGGGGYSPAASDPQALN